MLIGKRIALLGDGLNNDSWTRPTDRLSRRKVRWSILGHHRELTGEYDLAILMGYDRIIPGEYLSLPRQGTVLFHSSDLPRGRGWAPIYHTMSQGLPLTQCLLFAVPEVDAGPIIARARYPLQGNETEAEVRFIDDRLALMLLDGSLEAIITGQVRGLEQDHEKATWHERRTPGDSLMDMSGPADRMLDKARALPQEAPPFVHIRGRRFRIDLVPQEAGSPFDPSLVTMERFHD